MGGKVHLKLNIDGRPIANKYREGKMKRTLKRELKVLEIAKREANEPSHLVGGIPVSGSCLGVSCVLTPHLVLGYGLGSNQCPSSVSQSIRLDGESLGEGSWLACMSGVIAPRKYVSLD